MFNQTQTGFHREGVKDNLDEIFEQLGVLDTADTWRAPDPVGAHAPVFEPEPQTPYAYTQTMQRPSGAFAPVFDRPTQVDYENYQRALMDRSTVTGIMGDPNSVMARHKREMEFEEPPIPEATERAGFLQNFWHGLIDPITLLTNKVGFTDVEAPEPTTLWENVGSFAGNLIGWTVPFAVATIFTGGGAAKPAGAVAGGRVVQAGRALTQAIGTANRVESVGQAAARTMGASKTIQGVAGRAAQSGAAGTLTGIYDASLRDTYTPEERAMVISLGGGLGSAAPFIGHGWTRARQSDTVVDAIDSARDIINRKRGNPMLHHDPEYLKRTVGIVPDAEVSQIFEGMDRRARRMGGIDNIVKADTAAKLQQESFANFSRATDRTKLQMVTDLADLSQSHHRKIMRPLIRRTEDLVRRHTDTSLDPLTGVARNMSKRNMELSKLDGDPTQAPAVPLEDLPITMTETIDSRAYFQTQLDDMFSGLGRARDDLNRYTAGVVRKHQRDLATLPDQLPKSQGEKYQRHQRNITRLRQETTELQEELNNIYQADRTENMLNARRRVSRLTKDIRETKRKIDSATRTGRTDKAAELRRQVSQKQREIDNTKEGLKRHYSLNKAGPIREAMYPERVSSNQLRLQRMNELSEEYAQKYAKLRKEEQARNSILDRYSIENEADIHRVAEEHNFLRRESNTIKKKRAAHQAEMKKYMDTKDDLYRKIGASKKLGDVEAPVVNKAKYYHKSMPEPTNLADQLKSMDRKIADKIKQKQQLLDNEYVVAHPEVREIYERYGVPLEPRTRSGDAFSDYMRQAGYDSDTIARANREYMNKALELQDRAELVTEVQRGQSGAKLASIDSNAHDKWQRLVNEIEELDRVRFGLTPYIESTLSRAERGNIWTRTAREIKREWEDRSKQYGTPEHMSNSPEFKSLLTRAGLDDSYAPREDFMRAIKRRKDAGEITTREAGEFTRQYDSMTAHLERQGIEPYKTRFVFDPPEVDAATAKRMKKEFLEEPTFEMPNTLQQAERMKQLSMWERLFAPARFIVGEDNMRMIRTSMNRTLKTRDRFEQRVINIEDQVQDIEGSAQHLYNFMRGHLREPDLEAINPRLVKPAKQMRKLFDDMADYYNIPEEIRIPHYAPRRMPHEVVEESASFNKKFFGKEFSRKLDADLENWKADMERTGYLFPTEDDMFSLARMYASEGAYHRFMVPTKAQVGENLSGAHASQIQKAEELFDMALGRPTPTDKAVDETIKRVAKTLFGKDIAGRHTKNIASFITQLQYAATLGYNVFSSMKNLTQILLSVSTLDPNPIVGVNYFLRTMRDATTKQGRALMAKNPVLMSRMPAEALSKQFNVISNLPGIRSFNSTRNFARAFEDNMFNFFSWADRQNLNTSYYMKLSHALDQGYTMGEAMEQAYSHTMASQFMYGIDSPAMTKSLGDLGKPLSVLMSWPINYADLIYRNWRSGAGGKAKAISAVGSMALGAQALSLSGLSFQSIRPLETAKGHMAVSLLEDDGNWPLVIRAGQSTTQGISELIEGLQTGRRSAYESAIDNFAEVIKMHTPAGVQAGRIADFVEAWRNDWVEYDHRSRLHHKKGGTGAVEEVFGVPGEAALSLLGPTTAAHERWQEIEMLSENYETSQDLRARAIDAFLEGDLDKFVKWNDQLRTFWGRGVEPHHVQRELDLRSQDAVQRRGRSASEEMLVPFLRERGYDVHYSDDPDTPPDMYPERVFEEKLLMMLAAYGHDMSPYRDLLEEEPPPVGAYAPVFD